MSFRWSLSSSAASYPDHEYDITRTCGENPEGKDVRNRSLIRNRANKPTFLISGASPARRHSVRMRAYFVIFGGVMLAVFCLVIPAPPVRSVLSEQVISSPRGVDPAAISAL